MERCKWHGERRFEEGRHGDLGSSIESNLGHERRAFCLSLNAARPSSFTRIRDSNARPGRAIYHTEALRPIRGAFLVVRKRRDTWGFTIESRNRLRVLFCRSMSIDGRKMWDGTQRKKELLLPRGRFGKLCRLWTALNAPIENVCKVEGNGGRGSGTIPLAVLFVGKQVFQRNVGAATVGDFNNSLSSASQTRPTTMQTPNKRRRRIKFRV